MASKPAQKNHCNNKNGPYPRSKGRTEGHGEKALPLYRLLKKSERFSWTLKAEEALTKLKATLSNSPILVPPTTGEPLLLYVVATTQVVSVVLVVERAEEGHTLLVQRPVYFISEVLLETKVHYPQI
jgi:hypothetical protein